MLCCKNMKLLVNTRDQEYLADVRHLLEKKGIPVFISSSHTYRIRPMYTAYKKGLWVYLDSQWEDAKALLSNSSHTVAEPVDVKAFYASAEKEGHTYRNELFNKFMNILVIGIVLFLVIVFAVKIYAT